jgi:GMP reductase
MASYRTSEGREVVVKPLGPVDNLVQDIKGGIASCCTYIGCLKIKDMPKCAEFIRVRRQYNDVFERIK